MYDVKSLRTRREHANDLPANLFYTHRARCECASEIHSASEVGLILSRWRKTRVRWRYGSGEHTAAHVGDPGEEAADSRDKHFDDLVIEVAVTTKGSLIPFGFTHYFPNRFEQKNKRGEFFKSL